MVEQYRKAYEDERKISENTDETVKEMKFKDISKQQPENQSYISSDLKSPDSEVYELRASQILEEKEAVYFWPSISL